MIYAVEIMNGKYVKIGYSKDVESTRRVAELQTGNPFEIKEVFTIDGTLKQEKELHKALTNAFTRLRIPIPPNEWYPAKNPFFVEFLKKLKNSANTGLLYCDQYNQDVKQPGKNVTSLEPNIKWPSK